MTAQISSSSQVQTDAWRGPGLAPVDLAGHTAAQTAALVGFIRENSRAALIHDAEIEMLPGGIARHVWRYEDYEGPSKHSGPMAIDITPQGKVIAQ